MRAPLPRPFWVLWVGTLVNRLGGFVFTFLTLYLTSRRGFTVEHAGMVVALYGVGTTLAGPIGGLLADHVGRRAPLLVGLCGGAAAMIHLGFARSPLHIAAATLLLGAVGDTYRPALHATVSDLVPPERRARAYGLIFWAVNLGFAVAATLGGLIAERGFVWLFIADAGTSLAAGLLVWRLVPETRPTATRDEREAARSPLGDPPFLALVGANFALMLCYFQLSVGLPLDMRAHGLGADWFGGLVAINGVMIVVLQPFAARLAGGLDPMRLMAVGALLTGAGFASTALARTPAGYAATIAVWTLGEIAMSPVAPTIVAGFAPREARGRYQGLYQVSHGAASVAGPLVGSFVIARAPTGTLWAVCGLLGIASAASLASLSRAYRRRVFPVRADVQVV